MELENRKNQETKVEQLKNLIDKPDNDIDESFQDTQCGYWIFSGHAMQRFATKYAFVIVQGLLTCLYSSLFSYNKGILTTLEKRYGISSRVMGLIRTGYDCSAIFSAPILCYYFSQKHRPRVIAVGLGIVAFSSLMTAMLHAIYGPGEDALLLTLEYGDLNTHLNVSSKDIILDQQKQQTLCQLNFNSSVKCGVANDGGLFPPFYLFLIQFVIGMVAPLSNNMAIAYIDDNIKKSETPVFLSISYTVRMLGPSLGFAVSSFCLRLYISPNLTPKITPDDPRWLGAWWLGFLILFCIMIVFVFLVSLFPKEMPEAYKNRRRLVAENKKNQMESNVVKGLSSPSMSKMWITFKRVLTNKMYMFNTMAGIFYCFGYIPYWTFAPKYIETQYIQSASTSNLLTGAFSLLFSAIGIAIAGIVITKFKPSARKMAAWNIFVGIINVCAFVSFIFLGCSINDAGNTSHNQLLANNSATLCESQCHCDYVKFSPICGEDGKTYISPCHAGCLEIFTHDNGTKYYDNCGCIKSAPNNSKTYHFESSSSAGGKAESGSCPIDCQYALMIFILVQSIDKLLGSTGMASNALVSLRSVKEEDKTVSMGLNYTLVCIFAFLPSPILFGWLIDQSCLVWGKTCTGQSNCWKYDVKTMRYFINIGASIAIMLGVLCDTIVWYFVKDLAIFDKEETEGKENIMVTTDDAREIKERGLDN